MGFVTVKTIRVETITTRFGENLPEGTRIYVKNTDKIYKCKESVDKQSNVEQSVINEKISIIGISDRYATTSITPLTIGTGEFNITVEKDLAYTLGQNINILYDATNYMVGVVNAYNSSTGLINTTVNRINGTGSYSVWEINLTGEVGEQGTQGPTGIAGVGTQGAQGAQGVPGIASATGATGTQGDQGAQGAQGEDGSDGTQGDQGAQGVEGSASATGATGPTGVDGTQGNQGDQGDQGDAGPIGPTGSTGATGIGDRYATTSSSTMTIDLNSKSFTVETGLSYTSSQEIIVSESVANYMVGIVVSYNSSTGNIQMNTNYKLGNGIFNSWTVNISGAAGPKGITGATGATGATGMTGADSTVPGDQGDQGAPGADSTVPGPKGDQGDQGTPGDSGSGYWTRIADRVSLVTSDDNVELESTTTVSNGVLYKGSEQWLHDFHHPTGDSQAPVGFNVFLGLNAGNFTMGSTATAGSHASHNIGLGNFSLSSNTLGYNNVGIGSFSLRLNTIGSHNVGIGEESLSRNTSGSNNSAVGANTLYYVTTGSNNSAFGANALTQVATTSDNIGIGYHAGTLIANGGNNTTPSSSIFIGNGTRASANTQTNQIVIGHNAVGKGSNTITLGGKTISEIYMGEDFQSTVYSTELGVGTNVITSSFHVEGSQSWNNATTFGDNTVAIIGSSGAEFPVVSETNSRIYMIAPSANCTVYENSAEGVGGKIIFNGLAPASSADLINQSLYFAYNNGTYWIIYGIK